MRLKASKFEDMISKVSFLGGFSYKNLYCFIQNLDQMTQNCPQNLHVCQEGTSSPEKRLSSMSLPLQGAYKLGKKGNIESALKGKGS